MRSGVKRLFSGVYFKMPRDLRITASGKSLILVARNPHSASPLAGNYSLGILPTTDPETLGGEFRGVSIPSRCVAKLLTVNAASQEAFNVEVEDDFGHMALKAVKASTEGVQVSAASPQGVGDAWADQIDLSVHDFALLQTYVRHSLPFAMGWAPTVDQMDEATVLKESKAVLIEDDPTSPIVHDFLVKTPGWMSGKSEEQMSKMLEYQLEAELKEARKRVDDLRVKHREDPNAYPMRDLWEAEQRYGTMESAMKEKVRVERSEREALARRREKGDGGVKAGSSQVVDVTSGEKRDRKDPPASSAEGRKPRDGKP